MSLSKIIIFIIGLGISSQAFSMDLQQKNVAAEIDTENLHIPRIEEYPIRELKICFNDKLSKNEISNLKPIILHRLSSLALREKLSNIYNYYTEAINSKFNEKISAKRVPEGIKIKFISANNNFIQENYIPNELKELKKNFFDYFPFFEEMAFEKKKYSNFRTFRKNTIISFNKKVNDKLKKQTTLQYINHLESKFVGIGNGCYHMQSPIFSKDDTSLNRLLYDSGYLSFYEVKHDSLAKNTHEAIQLKIPDQIKNKMPLETLHVAKIRDLNNLIESCNVEKVTSFNSWFVTLQFTEKGKKFYKEATTRLLGKRAAFVLDSGALGRKIISAQVIREKNKNGQVSLEVNSYNEACDLCNILTWGPYSQRLKSNI